MRPISIYLFFLICLSLDLLAQTQTPVLVKDINPGQGGSLIDFLTNVDGVAFFWNDDNVHGVELWRSDGTSAGTYLIKDIYPGTNSSGNSENRGITAVNGIAYFWADDGIHGQELWRSDGTAAGTYLIIDINPGKNSSCFDAYYHNPITNVNGIAYFGANDEVHGLELWRSDGTRAGTYLVKDIRPGSGYSYYGSYSINDINGIAYFVADEGVYGQELWRSDGTANGTYLVKDINPGTKSSYPFGAANINGVACFFADDGVHGSELWRSDGTATGTYLIKDLSPGTGGVGSFITAVNGIAYFWMYDEVYGRELWRSDGTSAGTYLIKDIYPGTNSSGGTYNNYRINDVNGIAYFAADDGIHGIELWRSDGTANGTYLIKDINPGNASSIVIYLGGTYFVTAVNGIAYFWADDGIHGQEIWRSDGTEVSTYLTKDINLGQNSSGDYSTNRSYNFRSIITNVNGTAYFKANDGVYGSELWKLEGTSTKHFHQLTQNPSFQTRKRLAEGTSFKVCADGAEASVFKVSGGGLDYSQAEIRIPGTDVSQTGSFSLIQPPSQDSLVVRYKHPDYIQTLGTSVTLVAGVYATPSSTTPITTFDITVYHAPVLMVHGFKSDTLGFQKMENALSNSGWPKSLLLRVNYGPTSKKHFSVNKQIVPQVINNTLELLRHAGIAAGKVDIIGHSMGGLLTRIYLQGSDYAYDIHKLITLNTSHSGSQFANISSDLSFNPLYFYNVRNLLLTMSRAYLDEGAITDLAVNSEAIKELNKTGNLPTNLNYNNVPTHAVGTTYPYSFIPTRDGEFKLLNTGIGIGYLLNVNLDDSYGEITHDLIVPLRSQLGGLSINCTTTFNNQEHAGSMENDNIIQRVVYLLRQPITSSEFCQNGYSPPNLTYTKVFSFPKQSMQARRNASTDASIHINLPVQGNTVRGGSALQVQAVGSGLSSLWLFVNYSSDSLYCGYKVGNSANFVFSIDKLEGKRSVIAIGKTLTGEYVADTAYFYVSSTILTSDLTPTLYARPSVTSNTTPVTVVVDVIELLSLPTSGTITVRVTKDPRISLSCPTSATSINGRSVQNPVWTFDDTSNPDYYILTTTQPIAAGEMLSFGMTGTLSPGATTGVLSLSAVVIGGGEVKVTNNTDADKIDYY